VDFLLARIHTVHSVKGAKERVKCEGISQAHRVTIFPPGAADVALFSMMRNEFIAGFKTLDAHAKTGKTCADDEDVTFGTEEFVDGKAGWVMRELSLPCRFRGGT